MTTIQTLFGKHTAITIPSVHEPIIGLFRKFTDTYIRIRNHKRITTGDHRKDVLRALDESHKYETNEGMPLAYNNIPDMNNDINEIYHVIEPKRPVKRNTKVYVHNSFGEVIYTAPRASYVSIHKLQTIVDAFHNHTFEYSFDKAVMGYILYLLYVRIHPHSDGNGRISRYMFIENIRMGDAFIPLSSLLMSEIPFVDELVKYIFKWLDNTVIPESLEHEYYSMNVPLPIYIKIWHVVYLSMCYDLIRDVPWLTSTIQTSVEFSDYFCKGIRKSHEQMKSPAAHPMMVSLIKSLNEFIPVDVHERLLKLIR